jgi:hypothetical protein
VPGRSLVLFGFPLTTGMEILSPLALFSPVFRRVWVAVMVVFHVLSWQLLQVLFFHNLVLMPLLLTDVEQWRKKVARLRGTAAGHDRTSAPGA